MSTGFNGAAANSPRSAETPGTQPAMQIGFNGAAANSPRSAFSYQIYQSGESGLQWGRGKFAAEWPESR